MVRSFSSFCSTTDFGSSDEAVWKLASDAHGEGKDWVCDTFVTTIVAVSGVDGVRGVGDEMAGGLNHG